MMSVQTRFSSTTQTEISGTQLEQWIMLGTTMEWVWSMWMTFLAVSEQISWNIWQKFGTS